VNDRSTVLFFCGMFCAAWVCVVLLVWFVFWE
jgi:hypothetical protein